MKRIAMMTIAALLCAPSYAGTPAFDGDGAEAVAVPPPKPQRRDIYCEQVGSGLWDCEEEVCGDWVGNYCGCYIVAYPRDDP